MPKITGIYANALFKISKLNINPFELRNSLFCHSELAKNLICYLIFRDPSWAQDDKPHIS